ncbi:MAG: DUF4145 domain-containing protein [Planctomycetes bacterium]|nr:DUF4145 domain-containing protein [Planctomycetota bacterium]
MDSWWELGEGRGAGGMELAIQDITCPFCMERGNFRVAFHATKRHAQRPKVLNFDTLECGSCKGYVLCLWSAGHGLHGYRVLPWPLKIDTHPKEWPEDVGRMWVQAHRSLEGENWDAAAVMARSGLQLALRRSNAVGSSLKKGIEDVASKGLLPPVMREWADTVRELGNDAAHPAPGQSPTDPQDARDIVRFLDYVLEYLYSLPDQIRQYRARRDERHS